MLHKNIHSVGIIRSNRKHMPKASHAKLPSDNDINKGDVKAFEAIGINLVKWMDNKAVLMLSNYVSAYSLQKIKQRQKELEQSEAVSFPCLVKLYNKHMEGVDIMIQKKLSTNSVIGPNNI